MTQFSPRKMAASLFQTLKGYATLLQTAPGDISEILYKLKQGEIKHELQITDVPEFRKMLRNGASRLAYAILLVGLFIGAIGILDKRPDQMCIRDRFIHHLILSHLHPTHSIH